MSGEDQERQGQAGTATAAEERSEPGSEPNRPSGAPPQTGPGQVPPPVHWVPMTPVQGYPQMPNQMPAPSQPQQPEPVPWHRQGWFWLIVVVVALGVVTVLGIAALGALHGLTNAAQAQASAMQKQTATLGGIAAALQGMQQSLQSIGATLASISRELSQLVGLASAHAGSAAGAGAAAPSAAPPASAAR